MRKKGSVLASAIINDWNREKELKRIYESKKRNEQKIKEEQNSIK